MGKGKEGDGKGEGRKGREGRKRADPSPGLRKCKGGNPKSVGVRQLCLRRIGVRGQKSLKTAALQANTGDNKIESNFTIRYSTFIYARSKTD